MRRNQSLIAPLLLILIGVLVLVRNFRPDFPFWDLVAKYWPVVLVVWGIAKLAGALRPVEPGAPAWRPSLTIGEFFLALLVVLVGLSATKWIDVRKEIPWGGIEWPWSETYSFSSQAVKQPMDSNSELQVSNPVGDVHVTGGDMKEITVTVNKRIRAASEADAKKLDLPSDIEFAREGASYVLRVAARPQLRADLDITVPRATRFKADLRRGSVQAGDLEGGVGAEVERGDVTVSNITGDVRLQLRRGSLTARNIKGNIDLDGRGSDIQVADVTGQLLIRGDYSGALEFSNVAQGVKFNSSRTDMEIQKLPGRVDMTLGSLVVRNPGGLVSVSTRNKDIRIEDFAEKVQIVNRGASVELRTVKLPLKDIEVENHSGPIEVAIPEKSEFQIDATARRGEVDSEFPLPVQRDNDARSIKGKVGQAGATIKLSTSYGTITLKKLGTPPQQAAPVRPRQYDSPPPDKEHRPKRGSAVAVLIN